MQAYERRPISGFRFYPKEKLFLSLRRGLISAERSDTEIISVFAS